MKTKDLFAGCSVCLMPHDEVWLVSLTTDDERTVTMRTYQDLPDALDAVQEWALMLTDETEIEPDAGAAQSIIRETLARLALGEAMNLPASIRETVQRDELRTWFEREMETNRE